MARMIQLSDGRVIPETEMTTEQVAYYDRQNAAELLKNNPPATPLEAAIDKATGFADAAKADVTEEAEGDSETKRGDSETKRGDSETKRRDWVEEAYKCFIEDAGDIDPTDPVAAIEAYFQKNATDELKARCKAEGKDAKGCWRFIEAVARKALHGSSGHIEAVARKALHGSSGHIDPGVVYAIAMHWFEDVPKDWDKPAPSPKAKTAKPAKSAKAKKPAETPSEIKKEKAKAKAKAAKAKRKPKQSQGFFFEMLEMQLDGPNKDGPSSPQASAGASGEETAMEPSSLPASTSNESEVQG